VSGSALSSRLASEKVMRDVHRVMPGREFQSIEEANAVLARLAGPGLKEALKMVPTLSPQQEAQELAYRAMAAPTPHGPHPRPTSAGEVKANCDIRACPPLRVERIIVLLSDGLLRQCRRLVGTFALTGVLVGETYERTQVFSGCTGIYGLGREGEGLGKVIGSPGCD
jgi:hypothetical protein